MGQQHLERIAAGDPRLLHQPRIQLLGTVQDPTHAQRRCQQRAISLTKIRIALAYGHHDNHHRYERWTLLARRLQASPYARFLHDLNGLQLVGRRVSPEAEGPELVLLKTCKWNYALRRH